MESRGLEKSFEALGSRIEHLELMLSLERSLTASQEKEIENKGFEIAQMRAENAQLTDRINQLLANGQMYLSDSKKEAN